MIQRAIREWQRQFGKVVDLTVFEREILPLVRDVPLSRHVNATQAVAPLLLADAARREDAAPAARDEAPPPLGGRAPD